MPHPYRLTPADRDRIALMWWAHSDHTLTEMACLASERLGVEVSEGAVMKCKPEKLKRKHRERKETP